MTTTTDQQHRLDSIAPEQPDDPRVGRWRLMASAFALLALGLGIALVVVVAGDDGDGDAPAADVAPDGVVQILDDFATAFAARDDALMDSILADDFSGTVDIYLPDTTREAFTVGVSRTLLLDEVRASTYSVERSGDLLVAGSGPWTVAARETWTDPSNREEGTRIYAIVDDDGTPKLAGYYYVAVKVPVGLDTSD